MLKNVIDGIRPKTLVAAIVPPFVAHSLYLNDNGNTSYYYFALCVLLALFIQIATNFYNDAVDFVKGADENRVGPKRITGENNMGVKKVFYIGHLFIFLAFLAGIPLVLKGGISLLLLGLISLFLAYGYTGGPFPLAYLGLGELFVFIFFGLVATCGSYYLYSGEVSLHSVILGSQVGLLSSVLIAINNFRDRETDILVNKRTLATRMTDSQYLAFIDFLLFFPYIILLYFAIFVKISFFIPFLGMSFAHKVRHVIREYNDPKELNIALAMSGKHLFVFCLLFFLGSLWN